MLSPGASIPPTTQVVCAVAFGESTVSASSRRSYRPADCPAATREPPPHPGNRDDDIALLAARFDGIAPSDVAYWFLEPKETAPGKARRLARHALSRWGMEELADSVQLLVGEVVTNAVRYASRPVTLRLLRTDVLRCW